MLTLFNSMSRKLEGFQPLEKGKVRMYTCGPSIYQLPHIGNYRTFLYEDILLRYLEYLGYKVRRTLFITDVEDKAITEAEKESTMLKELTEKNTEIFLQELKNLRGKTPTRARKRLNFTFDKFKKACDRLHKFKDMVKSLQDVKSKAEKSNPKTQKLIATLKRDFEENMNNDLHVKDAFDALFKTVSKLFSLAGKGKVSVKDTKQAQATLKSIDQVFQVIF